MGLKLNIVEINSQLELMDKKLKNTIKNTKLLENKIRLFVVNDELDSEAYSSMKKYYKTVQLNISRGLICYCEAMIEVNSLYRRKLNSYYQFKSLVNEDQITQMINSVKKQIDRLKSVSEILFIGKILALEKLKKELNKQIEKLHRFEIETRKLYEHPKNLLNKFKQGVNCDKKIEYNNGTYNLDKVDLTWCSEVNKEWLNRECFKIKKPKDMSSADYKQYKEKVQEKIDSLMVKDGWDEEAVKMYLVEVAKLKADKEGSYFDKLKILNKQTEMVGSGIYSKMFSKSKLEYKEKALLVINQMNGEIDENGMLQLKKGYNFDKNMSPHSKFLEDYAESVEKAHEGKMLDDKRIHQFRMYIDRQNINYIRENYEGKTDFDKLLTYNEKMEDINKPLFFGSSSQLHNRFLKTDSFVDYEKFHSVSLEEDVKNKLLKEWGYKGQVNDKVKTANGLSEFIVNNKNGKFVTQWDVLENKNGENAGKHDGIIKSNPTYYKDNAGQKTIIETESFNYACKDTEDNNKAHSRLDKNPASGGKSGFENDLKKNYKKIWMAKDDDEKERIPYKEKVSEINDYEIYKENWFGNLFKYLG